MLKYILYIQFEKIPILSKNYLFENWGALLAAFNPYFFLSFILASLVKNPAFFKSPLNSASAFNKALDIPEEVVAHAVSGMLPKNKLRSRMMTRLRVFAGAEHTHAAQNPVELNF